MVHQTPTLNNWCQVRCIMSAKTQLNIPLNTSSVCLRLDAMNGCHDWQKRDQRPHVNPQTDWHWSPVLWFGCAIHQSLNVTPYVFQASWHEPIFSKQKTICPFISLAHLCCDHVHELLWCCRLNSRNLRWHTCQNKTLKCICNWFKFDKKSQETVPHSDMCWLTVTNALACGALLVYRLDYDTGRLCET